MEEESLWVLKSFDIVLTSAEGLGLKSVPRAPRENFVAFHNLLQKNL